MRQVNGRRKSARGSTAKPARRDSRKSTRAPAKTRSPAREHFGRRTEFRDGIFARTGRWLRRKLSIRRPMLYLTAAIMALVLVVALFAGGYVRAGIERINAATDAVSAYAGFGISEIHLAGENRTPPETILAVLNFKPGQSIFSADLRMAQARLMRLPWVASAQVTRRYPDSIFVKLAEKRPFALWQSTKGLFVIERSGAVITTASVKQFPHLPVFIGAAPKGGAALVDAIAAHHAVQARLQAMARISGRRWNLILDDGVTVKLPGTGWKKQLNVLEHLIVDKGILERNIQEIDLRSPDNYFFGLRGQKKPKQVTRENAA